VERVLELTKNRGGDIVFECAGSASTAEILTAVSRVRGEVVIVGLFDGYERVNLLDISFKEIRMMGSKVYEKESFQTAIDFMTAHPVAALLKPQLVKFEEINHAFRLLRRSAKHLKVILELPQEV
jgi:threonine dehydrogenase-like Zn-dependent dehydrogenase